MKILCADPRTQRQVLLAICKKQINSNSTHGFPTFKGEGRERKFRIFRSGFKLDFYNSSTISYFTNKYWYLFLARFLSSSSFLSVRGILEDNLGQSDYQRKRFKIAALGKSGTGKSTTLQRITGRAPCTNRYTATGGIEVWDMTWPVQVCEIFGTFI